MAVRAVPRDGEWRACVCLSAFVSLGELRDVKTIRRVTALAERMSERDECEFDEEVDQLVAELNEIERQRPEVISMQRQLRSEAQRMAASLGDGARRVEAARGLGDGGASTGERVSPARATAPPTPSVSGAALPGGGSESGLSAPHTLAEAVSETGFGSIGHPDSRFRPLESGPSTASSSPPRRPICGVKRKADWTDSSDSESDLDLDLTSSSCSSSISSSSSCSCHAWHVPLDSQELSDASTPWTLPSDLPDLSTLDDVASASQYLDQLVDGDLDELME